MGEAAPTAPVDIVSPPQSGEAGWPSTGAAYFALAVITFATFLNFFDAAAFNLLVEPIKQEFKLTNIQMGWLTGPANIVFYLLVMLPLSRMADIYPRKIVLAIGVFFIAMMNATGGIVTGFWTLFASRMMIGAGGTAHAPAAYSLLSDSFPPSKRALPFSLLQFGFIFGTSLSFFIAGHLFAWVSTWAPTNFFGISIHGWKYLLLMLAVPGLITGVVMLFIHEPSRKGVISGGAPLPFKTVVDELWKRRGVYAPMFLALAFGAMHALALPAWFAPLMMRVYHWQVQDIGNYMSPILFAGQITGLVLGPIVVNWLGKRYKDANIRAAFIFLLIALPFGIIGPMMPTGMLCLTCFGIVGACGMAAAPPQNLAIQLITPNEMRGQITGFYLMMFTLFGMCGPLLIGFFIDKLFGQDADVWKAMALSGVILSPIASYFMYRAIKPYGDEVARLEALETAKS